MIERREELFNSRIQWLRAEPNHIYDAGLSVWQAYREILKHWKVLFEISKYNHEHGTPYWPYKKGRDFLKQANVTSDCLRNLTNVKSCLNVMIC
jgi:hypothetical protein